MLHISFQYICHVSLCFLCDYSYLLKIWGPFLLSEPSCKYMDHTQTLFPVFMKTPCCFISLSSIVWQFPVGWTDPGSPQWLNGPLFNCTSHIQARHSCRQTWRNSPLYLVSPVVLCPRLHQQKVVLLLIALCTYRQPSGLAIFHIITHTQATHMHFVVIHCWWCTARNPGCRQLSSSSLGRYICLYIFTRETDFVCLHYTLAAVLTTHILQDNYTFCCGHLLLMHCQKFLLLMNYPATGSRQGYNVNVMTTESTAFVSDATIVVIPIYPQDGHVQWLHFSNTMYVFCGLCHPLHCSYTM